MDCRVKPGNDDRECVDLIGIRTSPRGIAESGFAAVLAASAITIILNEGFANWQALWLAAVLIGLAVSLTQARDAPG